jgi:hypothetical protein
VNHSQRETVAHGVIAATILIGSYMLVVDRLQGRLNEANAQATTLLTQVRECESLRDQVPQMTRNLGKAQAQAEQIRRDSAAAKNDRALYASLTELATRHKVRLDELQPAAVSSPPSQEEKFKTPSLPGEAPAPAVEQALAYSMVATASFSDIADFMRAMQSELGYSVIRSARILRSRRRQEWSVPPSTPNISRLMSRLVRRLPTKEPSKVNNKRRSQLGQTASIAAPVLLILGLRTVFSGGPAGADAAPALSQPQSIQQSAMELAAVTPAVALTPQQQRAVDWRATLQFEQPLRSPMDSRVDVVLLPTQAPEPEPVAVEIPVNPLDGLVLTATMGNQNAALAAISGKVYRIGEQVRPGWRLTSVDVRSGRILLTAENGDTAELIKAE